MNLNFEIDADDSKAINDWIMNEVYPEVIAEQKQSETLRNSVFARASWESGYPYMGASGGGTTYSFSPTGLGVVLKVECFNRTKDFTHYDEW